MFKRNRGDKVVKKTTKKKETKMPPKGMHMMPGSKKPMSAAEMQQMMLDKRYPTMKKKK